MQWFVEIGIDVTLWISGLVYLMPLRHRSHLKKRLVVTAVVWIIISVATIQIKPGIWGSPLPVLAGYYLLMVAFFLWCGSVNLSVAMYCSVWALLTQQIISEMWGLLFRVHAVSVLHIKGGYLPIATLFFAFWYSIAGVTIARWMPEKKNYEIGPRQLTSALFLLVIFELMSGMMLSDYEISITIQGMFIIILVQLYCVTVLYMQNELFKKSAMREELMTLELLQKQQADQYDLSKENIELINRKCHDLKHQIAAIRNLANEAEREKYLKEVEDSVRIYESIVKTGNDVLDTILTEKSLRCKERQIVINCVADGRQLAFIDSIDLYTIFGNAIDNAMESVEKFIEQDRRQIDVLIYLKQQFLVINIINPVEQQPEFEDSLPVTTKEDKGYHGYGLKSIRHTVKKYDGFLSVRVEDGCFSLKILFPVSLETA